MNATPQTKREVLDALEKSREEWPFSDQIDTAQRYPWPLAWDAAAYAEEWFAHDSHNDLEEAVCHFPISPEKWGYDAASWHSKKPPAAMLKAQLLRLVNGWSGETKLLDYIEDEPALVEALDFDELPSQSSLWRVRDQRLSAKHLEVLETIAEVFVHVARDNGVPTPDDVFPKEIPQENDSEEDDLDEDAQPESLRTHTIEKSQEVWEHAKPYVAKSYEINRADNAEIPKMAWWEAHAYMGSREFMCSEDGLTNFTAETTRNRVQSGSHHRHTLQKLDVDDIRRNHRRVTKRLIDEAKSHSQLNRKVTVAIDRTKSNPWRNKKTLEGYHEEIEKRDITEKWILGYEDQAKKKDKAYDYYFQWAAIKIVGHSEPLVLDAVPIYRGMSRQEIVDELLKYTTDMVNIDLVLMDREYQGSGVKEACEKHGVHYLNMARMHSSEKATCSEMRRADEAVRINERDTVDETRPIRKEVYLPARNLTLTNDESDDADEESHPVYEPPEEPDDSDLRATLLNEWEEDVINSDDDIETDGGHWYSDVVKEIGGADVQRPIRGSDSDARRYILFETNHPDISNTDDNGDEYDQRTKLHMAARFIRRYSHRWGIENGFKKIKSFRVRTTSKDHEYRFLNFMFASTLYNVWRLVDLLVKLSLGIGPDHEPVVTSDLFLTVAKQFFGGIPPPD